MTEKSLRSHGIDPGSGVALATLADTVRSDGDAPRQAEVVAALRAPAAFGPDCRAVEVIETHISYVFLTGRYAYKVKKAVRFPFVDFGTLDARRRCCELELLLNRRTAPSLYLGVVPIVRRKDGFGIAESGDAVEWAVRMRQFPQRALLSHVLERGELTIAHVDLLAERTAAFHESITERAPRAAHGSPAEALRLAVDNFDQIAPLVDDAASRARLGRLRAWTLHEHAERAALMDERLRNGFVRSCHGDLHLDNIVLVDGEPLPFDCIEFNPALRWCDVIADIAYTAMDLRARNRDDLARRLVNRYLEVTGDYAGAALLRFHLVYRAVVRAKVAYLRAGQEPSASAADEHRAHAAAYLALADRLTQQGSRTIIAMHGLSGCGKTTLAQALVDRCDVARIRMDVERKRLRGLAAGERSGSRIDEGLYSQDMSRTVYEHVARLTGMLAAAGQPVVVDGAFLRRWQRDLFREVARRSAARFVMLDLAAPEALLRARVASRSAQGSDASEADVAVLEHQLATHEPLGADEQACSVELAPDATETLRSDRWRALVASLSSRIEPD